ASRPPRCPLPHRAALRRAGHRVPHRLPARGGLLAAGTGRPAELTPTPNADTGRGLWLRARAGHRRRGGAGLHRGGRTGRRRAAQPAHPPRRGAEPAPPTAAPPTDAPPARGGTNPASRSPVPSGTASSSQGVRKVALSRASPDLSGAVWVNSPLGG